jgi:hypothetical protein
VLVVDEGVPDAFLDDDLLAARHFGDRSVLLGRGAAGDQEH